MVLWRSPLSVVWLNNSGSKIPPVLPYWSQRNKIYIYMPYSFPAWCSSAFTQLGPTNIVLIRYIVSYFKYLCSQKYRVQRICGMILLIATSSASVELLLLSFCFLDVLYISPFSSNITLPVWLWIFWCTTKATFIHHKISPESFMSRVRTRSLVYQR